MDYIFILGKNPKLSTAEVLAYLHARDEEICEEDRGEEFLVTERGKLPPRTMEELGGTLKIGETFFATKSSGIEAVIAEMEEKTDFNRLFAGLPEKPLFSVSCYGNADGKALSDFLKRKMKEYGLKPGYIHSDVPLTHTEVLKKRLLEKGCEFLACKGETFRLGRTIAVHNPYEFQKRDIERPVQRAIFSIPPRLAKIMINLTGATKGVLLDPFCGIGSILQEGALMGFDVRGEDIDDAAIKGCRMNLAWLENTYNIKIGNLSEKVRQGDARKLNAYFAADSVDVIVTEPYLGEPLRHRPDEAEAKKILESLGPLFAEALKEMGKILKRHGTVAIVSPFFEVGKKHMGLDMQGMAKKAGLILFEAHEDYEERHMTLRMINVLKKV